MPLPLLERAKEDGVTYVLTSLPKRGPNTAPGERLHGIAPFPAAPRIPQRGLEPGEQYRFHFDMTTCVGCKCCIVACNEQNGNPADINWRRVGEIEGGWRLVSRHATLLSVHGLQSLPGAFVPDWLSGGCL